MLHEKANEQFGRSSNITYHCAVSFCCPNRDRWRLSHLVMVEEPQGNTVWNPWCHYLVYLWNNSYFATCKFWKSIFCLWGIFIAVSIIWGIIVDKKRPDRYEIVGSAIAVCGAAIIFYVPR